MFRDEAGKGGRGRPPAGEERPRRAVGIGCSTNADDRLLPRRLLQHERVTTAAATRSARIVTDEFLAFSKALWQRSLDPDASLRLPRSQGRRPLVPLRPALAGGLRGRQGAARRCCERRTRVRLSIAELADSEGARGRFELRSTPKAEACATARALRRASFRHPCDECLGMIRSALMNVMTAAALKAGAWLEARFRRGREPPGLGQGSRATSSPPPTRSAEKTVFEELSKAQARLRLRHGGIGRRWKAPTRATPGYVDPLDGTTNFLHSASRSSASRSRLANARASSIAGVVYNPADRRHVRRRARPGRLPQQTGACASPAAASSPIA